MQDKVQSNNSVAAKFRFNMLKLNKIKNVTKFFCTKLAVSAVICSFAIDAADAHKRRISVPMNRAELVNLPEEMSEVMVANPEIADVLVHGADKISIIAKAPGATDLRVFDTENGLMREYDVVVGHDIALMRKTLKDFFPSLNVGIQTINNSIAVTGLVPDASTANRVMQVAYEFIKDSRTERTTSEPSPGSEKYPGIVNLLKLNSGQQVMLKVKVGEVNRTALKRLGVDLQGFNNAGNNVFGFATGALTGLPITGNSFQSYQGVADNFISTGLNISKGNFGAGLGVQALEREGLFKVLAEPNLTAVSGEKARFLAGGEFPIVSVTEDSTNVEFKEYGISVAFTPVVLSQNRIRLAVAPELSDLSAATGVQQGGISIPGLTTRKAKTTVELAPGESFMIAGLIRDQINTSIDEVPGIAEIPLISSLLRSVEYQREETELVISVTPYLVDPVASSDIKFPVDEYRSPSLMDMMFYGALTSLSGDADRVSQTPSLEGPVGFITD